MIALRNASTATPLFLHASPPSIVTLLPADLQKRLADRRIPLELTDAAAEAGADAVKVQYFETDRLMI